MKKLLFTTLILISSSVFSEDYFLNVKQKCQSLDNRLTNAFNLDEKHMKQCEDNNYTCGKEANKMYDVIQKSKKSNIEEWKNLGCATILYK
jgi:hypothetical protein